MALQISTFPAGPIETNAYLVVEPESNKALIIDAPMDVTDALVSAVEREGASVTVVYITHAHWDHIGDAAALKRRTAAPLASHRLCQAALERPGSSVMELPFEIEPVSIDQFVEDGDTLMLGSVEFLVMHLPGHEPGHTALYSETERVFLGGDVLFPNGHGRIDIPGASEEDMAASLRRLSVLPPDVVVYPGHGLPTTISAEPWLQSYS